MSALEKKNCLQVESEKGIDPKQSPKAVTSSQIGSIQNTQMEGLDGGWALVASFGSCLIKLIMAGLGNMSGVFFMAFMKIFHFYRKTVSILFSDPLVGFLGQKNAVCKAIIAGGTVVTICFAAYFCTATWRNVIYYRVNGLCASLAINVLKLIIAQCLYKRYIFAAGIAFSLRNLVFLVFLVLMKDFLSIHGIEDTFLIVEAIILYITFTLLKNDGVQKKMSYMEENMNNLSREERDLVNIKKIKLTTVKEFTPTMLKHKITKDCLEEEISLTSIIKTSVRSANEYTPEKEKLRDTIRRSYSYPDMKFLKENSELVLKIINFKNMDNSKPGTEVNQNAFYFLDEIERLCSSLRNSQLVSQFHKNLRQSKRNLFGLEEMVNLKAPCDQRYGSFPFGRESLQTETPRRQSLPDFSKLALNASRTCLNQLYNLELNKQHIVATYPEEKEQIMLVLTEFCKLNKLNP